MLFNNIENLLSDAQLSAIELSASSFPNLTFEEVGNLVAQTYGMYLSILGGEDVSLSPDLSEQLLSRAIMFIHENVAPVVNDQHDSTQEVVEDAAVVVG